MKSRGARLLERVHFLEEIGVVGKHPFSYLSQNNE